jgi:hypothetical protein
MNTKFTNKLGQYRYKNEMLINFRGAIDANKNAVEGLHVENQPVDKNKIQQKWTIKYVD